MFRNRLILFPVSILILSLLACNLQSAATPTTDLSAAATAVVQTLTAAAASATQPPVATATGTATNTLVPPTNTPIPVPTQICDNAQFISETVPDGTVEAAGAAFVKTWRLKNVGSCTWNSSYATVFVSGNAMSAPSVVPFTGNVAPGQEVDVAVNMQAPATPGNYTGNWTLRNASGVLFGLGASNGPFFIKITVPAPTATVHLSVLPITTQVFTQITVAASAVGHVVTNCPSGSVVTGGGFAGNNNLFVFNDSAIGNAWQVYAQNTSASSQLLNSYAICLSNSSGATTQVFTQVTALASSAGHVVTNCPSGSVVTGGGFAGNTNLLVYNSSGSGNGWEADAMNSSASSQLLNSYAICLSGTSGSTQQILLQVSAPGSGIGHSVALCPSGTLLTGGGFAGSQNMFVYSDSATGSGWEVDAQNLTGSSQLLNSYALCLTLP